MSALALVSEFLIIYAVECVKIGLAASATIGKGNLQAVVFETFL